MKETDIDFLACPGSDCDQTLKIKEIFSCFPSRKKEIKEGLLFCENCQQIFPIFLGIPILVYEVSEYLVSNFNILEAITAQHGGMDKRLFADSMLLIKKKQSAKKTITTKKSKEQVSNIINNARHNPNLIHHYHDLSELLYTNHPLHDLVQKYKTNNPVRILEQFLQNHVKTKKGIALEIGCSFGGFLKILKDFSETVVGVDLAFLPLFFASCILKHLPIRIGDFNIQIERNSRLTVNIEQIQINNLLLVVGNGESLPFNKNSFSTVSSLNVLDVIDHPQKLLKEKIRILKKEGQLLASAPFDFSEKTLENFGLKTGENIWNHIKKNLQSRISILEVQDNVPWLMYQYHRYMWVYNNFCFCGKKIK